MQKRHVSYGQNSFAERDVPVNSSNSSLSGFEDKLYKIKLRIVTTSTSMYVYGKMKKEKLLEILTNKLIHDNDAKHRQSDTIASQTKTNIFTIERLQAVIHRGIYSEKVIKALRARGVPIYAIVKAMKLGLLRLSSDEFSYFKIFEVSSIPFVFGNECSKHFNQDLILILKAAGLTDAECWRVIMMGLVSQESCMLYRMALSGIDIPGILKWEKFANPASAQMLQFLRVIGIEEHVIKRVNQAGIDDESIQLLTDLGYKEDDIQEISYERTLNILGPCNLKNNEDYNRKSMVHTCVSNKKGKKSSKQRKLPVKCNKSEITDVLCSFKPFTCYCHERIVEDISQTELTAQRNDYLRQSVMIPLAWALGRTLRDGPSDPKHYLAHQLLRWKYNTVPSIQKVLDEVKETVVAATLQMDTKLVEKLMAKNIRSCESLVGHYKLHHIKKGLWIYTTRYETCEFSKVCGSCKVNLSEIMSSTSTSTSSSKSLPLANNIAGCF